MKKIIICALFSAFFISCNNPEEKTKNLQLATKVQPLVDPAQAKVEQWSAYRALEQNIRTISNTNALNSISLQERMVRNVSAMSKQIPEELRTKNVIAQIARINEKVERFYKEIDEEEMHERVVDRHLREIIEAFDDLNKEINHAVIKHM